MEKKTLFRVEFERPEGNSSMFIEPVFVVAEDLGEANRFIVNEYSDRIVDSIVVEHREVFVVDYL